LASLELSALGRSCEMSRTGGRGNLTGDAPEAEPRSVDEWKEEEADDDDDDDEEEEEAEDGCMCMACTSVPAYVASTLSARIRLEASFSIICGI